MIKIFRQGDFWVLAEYACKVLVYSGRKRVKKIGFVLDSKELLKEGEIRMNLSDSDLPFEEMIMRRNSYGD